MNIKWYTCFCGSFVIVDLFSIIIKLYSSDTNGGGWKRIYELRVESREKIVR